MNPVGSYLYNEFSNAIIRVSVRVIEECNLSWQYTVPLHMIAKLNAHALMTVFEWAYIEKQSNSREEILHYIKILTEPRESHGQLGENRRN